MRLFLIAICLISLSNCVAGDFDENDHKFFYECAIALDTPQLLAFVTTANEQLVIARVEPSEESGYLESTKMQNNSLVIKGIHFSRTIKILKVLDKDADLKVGDTKPFDWYEKHQSLGKPKPDDRAVKSMERVREIYARTTLPAIVLGRLKKQSDKSPFTEYCHLSSDLIDIAIQAIEWLKESGKIEGVFATEERLRQGLLNENIFVSAYAAKQLIKGKLWGEADWKWLVKDAPDLLKSSVVLHACLDGIVPEFVSTHIGNEKDFKKLEHVLKGLVLSKMLLYHYCLDKETHQLLGDLLKKFKSDFESDKEWMVFLKAHRIAP